MSNLLYAASPMHRNQRRSRGRRRLSRPRRHPPLLPTPLLRHPHSKRRRRSRLQNRRTRRRSRAHLSASASPSAYSVSTSESVVDVRNAAAAASASTSETGVDASNAAAAFSRAQSAEEPVQGLWNRNVRAQSAQRSRCKDCGTGRCEHNRQSRRCKDCGTGRCEHQRRADRCRECGGGQYCEHHRLKNKCRACADGEMRVQDDSVAQSLDPIICENVEVEHSDLIMFEG